MEHDAWFFVGVFVFIFLIWIVTGGPTHPIAYSGPTLSAPTPIGSGSYLSLPQIKFGGGTNVALPGSSNGEYGNMYSGNSSVHPSNVPGVIFAPPSPYRDIVSLNNYVSNADATDPAREYVQLYVAQNASSPIDITGWTLRSGATINAELIPTGTAVPGVGVVNNKRDIVLNPGDKAIIVSGESPIGGSFRENKCTGYFGSLQKFTPPLSSNCPSASNDLYSYYGASYIHDPSCIDYVDTLSRCQVAIPPKRVSDSCESFAETYLNYNGCVELHQNDADFNGTTWRIYLGRDNSMWRSKHEVVELVDYQGKTVASFNY